MPDTRAWRDLVGAAHDWHEEPPADGYDQVDALVRDLAGVLGFHLDRPTLEAALFGVVASVSVACLFEEQTGGSDLPEPENTVLGQLVARCILVKRLDALGPTGEDT
jgi:hypothetical protein